MFKKKHNVQLMLEIGNNEDFELLDTLIKEGWKIKKTVAHTTYYIHVTLNK